MKEEPIYHGDFITYHVKADKDNRYIQHIVQKYDLNLDEVTDLQIPLVNMEELNTFDWNIGLICGESGSGKSTVLSNRFGTPVTPVYDNEKPVMCQFPNLEPEEVTLLLESVGLASVPVWLRKPNNLSVGEKARLDLAWLLVNIPKDQIITIDEFTSTINRETAKSLAFCLQRFVRENNRKVVISTCHFDMIEFLQPDWIYNLNKRKNDAVELERLVYLDEYENYPNMDTKDILTTEMMV